MKHPETYRATLLCSCLNMKFELVFELVGRFDERFENIASTYFFKSITAVSRRL